MLSNIHKFYGESNSLVIQLHNTFHNQPLGTMVIVKDKDTGVISLYHSEGSHYDNEDNRTWEKLARFVDGRGHTAGELLPEDLWASPMKVKLVNGRLFNELYLAVYSVEQSNFTLVNVIHQPHMEKTIEIEPTDMEHMQRLLANPNDIYLYEYAQRMCLYCHEWRHFPYGE